MGMGRRHGVVGRSRLHAVRGRQEPDQAPLLRRAPVQEPGAVPGSAAAEVGRQGVGHGQHQRSGSPRSYSAGLLIYGSTVIGGGVVCQRPSPVMIAAPSPIVHTISSNEPARIDSKNDPPPNGPHAANLNTEATRAGPAMSTNPRPVARNALPGRH